MLLHPDRYYPTTTLIKRGVVIHDSESGDASSSILVRLLEQPGNQPSKHGGFYGAGYHAVTDGEGGYVSLADATAGPYSAPPCNPTWWHICMPGFAHQTRAEWLDQWSRPHIEGVAKFIIDKWNADGRTWPLSFIFADQLVKGMKGYTSHYQVALAWRKTTHTDPGPNFPWDVLEDEIVKAKLQPTEEDDVADVYYCNAEPRTWQGTPYPAGNIKYFLQNNGVPRRISGEELADRGHPNVDVKFGIEKSNAYLDSVGAPQ